MKNIIRKLLREALNLPDTTHQQELKYLNHHSLSSQSNPDVNLIKFKILKAAKIANEYAKSTQDYNYFMLSDDGQGFYQVEFKSNGNIRTKQIQPSADMNQLNSKFHPTDVGTCKDYQNIARYCFVKAGKPISMNKFSVGISPADDAAIKALVIFKNEILNFYQPSHIDPIQSANISKEKMSDKQSLHKQKKDLETSLGFNLSDSQWNNYLNTGEKPSPKSTTSANPNDLLDFQLRQKAAQDRRNQALNRLKK